MDPNFAFPRVQTPISLPALNAHSTMRASDIDKRDSNALRASVLDVVLQLGLGTNGKVAEWMFNNSVGEDDEGEPFSPFTSGSTGTSDEYFPPTLPSFIDRAPPSATFSPTPSNDLPRKPPSPILVPVFDLPESVLAAAPIAPVSKGKLRKKRIDGYETDSFYVGEVTRIAAKKQEQDVGKRSRNIFGKQNKKVEQGGKASLLSIQPSGYKIDGPMLKSVKPKKFRTKWMEDTGYEAESGYTSSSSKGRSKGLFFGKGKKKTNTDPPSRPPPPPLPSFNTELGHTLLPIASKFSTPISTPGGIHTVSTLPLTQMTLQLQTSARNSQEGNSPSFLSMTPSPISPISGHIGTYTTFSQLQSSATAADAHSRCHSYVSGLFRSFSQGSQTSDSSNHRSISTKNSNSSRSSPIPIISRKTSATFPRSETLPVHPTSSAAESLAAPFRSISPNFSGITLSAKSAAAQPISTLIVPPFSPGQIFHLPSSPRYPVAPISPSPSEQISTGQPSPLIPDTSSARSSPSSPASLLSSFPKIPPTLLSVNTLLKNSQLGEKELGGAPKRYLKPTVHNTRPSTSPQSDAPRKTVTFADNSLINDSEKRDEENVYRTRTRSTSETVERRMQPTRQVPGSQLTKQTSLPHIRLHARMTAWPHQHMLRTDPLPLKREGIGKISSSSESVTPFQNTINHPDAVLNPARPLRLQIKSAEGRLPLANPSLPTTNSLLISPPAERFRVHSRSTSPMLSPHVLAYYDIPPPSPPPDGPLPSVPEMPLSQSHLINERGRGRTRLTQLRTVAGTVSGEVRRGKELPFPQRPIRLHDPPGGSGGPRSVIGQSIVVPRYRELHTLALSDGTGENMTSMERRKTLGGQAHGYGDKNEEDIEGSLSFHDSLGRPEGPLIAVYDDVQNGTGTSLEKDGVGRPQEESQRNSSKNETGGGERSSRWSGSIYSRGSFLDSDKSEEARFKFLSGVESMYFANGRERAVPPVPKLPDMLTVGGSRRGIRF